MSDETPTTDVSSDEATTSTGRARRPRRAVSRPAGPPAVSPADAAPSAAPAEPEAPAEAPAKPAKKAAAKKSTAAKPAKKTAAKKTAAAAEPAEEAPAAEPAADAAPAKRTRSRKAAAPAFSTDPEPAAEASGAPAPAAVLMFQAPTVDAPAAPGRKRAAKKAAPAPVEETPAEDDLDEDAEALDAEDAEALDAEAAETDGEGAEDGDQPGGPRRRRRRGGRGRRRRTGPGGEDLADVEPVEDADAEGDAASGAAEADAEESEDSEGGSTSSRRRRRRRRGAGGDSDVEGDDPPNTVVRVREPRARSASSDVTAVKGSTRLEAKKQRRREGREAGRRRPSILTEAEFLARREAVDRVMVVRQRDDRTQVAVLEDGILVEHYVNRNSGASMIGNVYLGRVQNVLPSMEAAFVDVGRGRNAVLYAGEVNWDAAGLEGQPKRIEAALKSGDAVLVQVTKDPQGHKGARLTAQISLPGRFLVYVPEGQMTGISRKLPDTERTRLKSILRQVVPEDAGVIVRTAAEGASEEELRNDVARLAAQWADIQDKAAKATKAGGPALLHGEPDLAIKVVRDIFNEDFGSLVVEGDDVAGTIREYVEGVAPDLAERVKPWVGPGDLFNELRIDEQLAKALDRKVWLPSGGSLVIDRTEAMTVVDVNTGKFVGQGGNLEETVTRNNLEAAEEIVRQLRLRDIGGIIVIDFIDMVLESNRDLVLRRLVECLGRDRTKHQVAEVTSLGLVQMTRKRIGQGLLEVFTETCEACQGRGYHVHAEPVAPKQAQAEPEQTSGKRKRKGGDSDGEGRSKAKAKAATKPDVEPRVIDPKVSEAMEKVHAAAARRAAEAAAAAAEGREPEPEDLADSADLAEAVAVLDAAEAAAALEGAEASPAPEDSAEAPAPAEAAPKAAPRKRGPRKATRKAGPAS